MKRGCRALEAQRLRLLRGRRATRTPPICGQRASSTDPPPNCAKRSGAFLAALSRHPARGASSCTRIPARVFSRPLRATAGGVRARLGPSAPRHRLDVPPVAHVHLRTAPSLRPALSILETALVGERVETPDSGGSG